MFYHLSYRSARERLDLLSIVREEGRDSIGLVDPSCVAVGLGTEGRSRIDQSYERRGWARRRGVGSSGGPGDTGEEPSPDSGRRTEEPRLAVLLDPLSVARGGGCVVEEVMPGQGPRWGGRRATGICRNSHGGRHRELREALRRELREAITVLPCEPAGGNCRTGGIGAGVLGQPELGPVRGFWCPNKFGVRSRGPARVGFFTRAPIFNYEG